MGDADTESIPHKPYFVISPKLSTSQKVHYPLKVFLFLYRVLTYFHYLRNEILIQVVHVSGNRSLLDYKD